MQNTKIKIGKVDKLMLFGGGALLVDFAREAIDRKIKTCVFAVRRHLDEIIYEDSSVTLEKVLKKENIPFFCVRDINNLKIIKSMVTDSTIGIGLGENYTFSKATIKLFSGRLFDFMVIRLPQYRGGAHFTWQILRKNRIGCWNIQIINEEMIPGVFDSGEVLKTREYVIPHWAKTPVDYFKIAHQEGMKLFVEFMDDIVADVEFRLVKPQENLSCYLPRLFTLKHAFINWAWNVDEIERFVNAFDEPYAGASTFLNGQRVFLKTCQADYSDGQFHPFISGIVYRIYKNTIFTAGIDGTILVKAVLDEKKNNIINKLKTGMRFYTPVKYLEDAMTFNADYDSEGLVRKNK